MSQMISFGDEIIRINPKNSNKIEYSKNNGSSWSTRYSGTSYGEFDDLVDNGNEILAMTSKGIYYSRNKGSSWSKRS